MWRQERRQCLDPDRRHSEVTLWITCPVYQDVPSFLILRDKLLTTLPPHRHPVRFVVLDDTAGTDPDVEQVRVLPDVDVITPPFNLGHQRGVVFAARWVVSQAHDDDIIVTMDSDGEDRPEDVEKLVQALDVAPPDPLRVAVARRTQRHASIVFRSFYAVFKLFFRILTGATMSTGNFAAYRRVWARRRLMHPHFDLAYSSTLVTIGASLTLVPCARGTRYAGTSRMGFSRLVTHGVRMLMPFGDRIAVRALLAFTATLFFCVIASVAILVIRLFTSWAVPGWATYSLLSLLLLSAVSVGNLVVLFAVVSQSQGISLANLEGASRELTRESSSGSD